MAENSWCSWPGQPAGAAARGGSTLAFPRVENKHGPLAAAAAPRGHRCPGRALMGTMDFKADPSAVTINLLLIVHPEETASKQKGQRERQTEGGRGAGNVPPAAGARDGRAARPASAARWTVKQSSSFGAGLGLSPPPPLSSFPLQTCCKTPKLQTFLCGSPAWLGWSSRCRRARAAAALHAAWC